MARMIDWLKKERSLRVSEATLRRAYDYAYRDETKAAVSRGEKPKRGSYSHLGIQKNKEIRRLIGKGRKPKEIAASVGCSESTVRRVQVDVRNKAS